MNDYDIQIIQKLNAYSALVNNNPKKYKFETDKGQFILKFYENNGELVKGCLFNTFSWFPVFEVCWTDFCDCSVGHNLFIFFVSFLTAL